MKRGSKPIAASAASTAKSPKANHTRKANSVKSKVRVFVEHVFAQEKAHMGLFIRTIGLRRAEAKSTLVNLPYNMKRLIFHELRAAAG
jgi:transposase, IS5 family